MIICLLIIIDLFDIIHNSTQIAKEDLVIIHLEKNMTKMECTDLFSYQSSGQLIHVDSPFTIHSWIVMDEVDKIITQIHYLPIQQQVKHPTKMEYSIPLPPPPTFFFSITLLPQFQSLLRFSPSPSCSTVQFNSWRDVNPLPLLPFPLTIFSFSYDYSIPPPLSSSPPSPSPSPLVITLFHSYHHQFSSTLLLPSYIPLQSTPLSLSSFVSSTLSTLVNYIHPFNVSRYLPRFSV